MSKYFLMFPNYWAIGSSPQGAWQRAKALSGKTQRQIKAHQYFMLKFPSEARFDVNEVTGDWNASHKPVALVDYSDQLPPEQIARFTKAVEKGALEQKERQKTLLSRNLVKIIGLCKNVIVKSGKAEHLDTGEALEIFREIKRLSHEAARYVPVEQ